MEIVWLAVAFTGLLGGYAVATGNLPLTLRRKLTGARARIHGAVMIVAALILVALLKLDPSWMGALVWTGVMLVYVVITIIFEKAEPRFRARSGPPVDRHQ
jgi:hypothetical protein